MGKKGFRIQKKQTKTMNTIDNEDWECSTCKQTHPASTDYECSTCGMLASEHISITQMCKTMRRWQDQAYSLELQNKRLLEALDKSTGAIDSALDYIEHMQKLIKP